MPQADFVKLLGRRGIRELNRLVERGAVHREVTIPRPGVAPKYEGYLIPAQSVNPEPVEGRPELTARQQSLLDAVRQPPGHLPVGEANREFGRRAVEVLWEKGLVAQGWWRTSGGPPPIPALGSADGPEQLTLTDEQRQALSEITAALDASFHPPFNSPPEEGRGMESGEGARLPVRSFLLHGVTGSGKTEVYLRAIDHAVRLRRRAVFLVPEIALTPQTLERVNAWFAGRVALLQ